MANRRSTPKSSAKKKVKAKPPTRKQPRPSKPRRTPTEQVPSSPSILKVRPSLPELTPSVTTLIPLLERFARSERAPLLGEMQVSQVLPETKTCVNGLSFLDLGKLDEHQLGSLFRKKPTCISALEKYLQSVLPEESTAPAMKRPTPDIERSAEGLPTLSKVFGSSEAELLLIDTVQKLLAAKSFDDKKHQRLAEYWDPRWPRAPFEEAMTFAQLSRVNTEAFLKKRSMTPQKVAAVIGAVERFLSQPSEQIAPPTAPPPATPTPSPHREDTPTQTNSWPKSELYLPSHAIGFLKFFELQANAVAPSSSFGKLVLRLPQVLSTAEFVFLWMHCDYEPSMVSNLLKLDADTGQKIFEEGCSKLRRELENEHAARYQLMRLTLGCAAAPRDAVLKALADQIVDVDFMRVINLLSLRALGAVRPRAFDHTLKDYLTLNEAGLEAVLELILLRLPLPEKELKELLASALPLVRFEDLVPALSRRAHYDKHRNAWIHSKR